MRKFFVGEFVVTQEGTGEVVGYPVGGGTVTVRLDGVDPVPRVVHFSTNKVWSCE